MPVELMLTTLWLESNAKLSGALIVEPEGVHVGESSSATNASLYVELTYPRYSSERKRKSNVRQLALGGTLRSIFRMLTSKSLFPRAEPPPSLALAKVPGLPTELTLPLVSTPNDDPAVGKPASAVVETPSGVPPGWATNEAPVTIADGGAIACAIVSADDD